MGSEQKQGELWSAEPTGWAGQERRHAPLFGAMIDAAGVGHGHRVLDIGCGAGHSCGLIAATGASVVGVDAAAGLIDHARRTVGDAEFHVGGIEDLEFADDEFDVVFAANSVQYAADLGAALAELKRVCKPEGAVVAGLFGPPDDVTYRPVLEALGPFMPPPPPGAKPGGPFRLSSPGVLAAAFADAGLEVVEQGAVNCPFSYESWDEFWQIAHAAGPTQMAIGHSGADVVEEANRQAVEPFVAPDGSITFDPNQFVYVVGRPATT